MTHLFYFIAFLIIILMNIFLHMLKDDTLTIPKWYNAGFPKLYTSIFLIYFGVFKLYFGKHFWKFTFKILYKFSYHFGSYLQYIYYVLVHSTYYFHIKRAEDTKLNFSKLCFRWELSSCSK